MTEEIPDHVIDKMRAATAWPLTRGQVRNMLVAAENHNCGWKLVCTMITPAQRELAAVFPTYDGHSYTGYEFQIIFYNLVRVAPSAAVIPSLSSPKEWLLYT
jgi:hypothetical protein